MKIGIISDTRVTKGDQLPPEVFRAFDGVDLILHAGGIYTSDVLDKLEDIAPIKATGRITSGDAERPLPTSMEGGGDPRVSGETVLELEGHKIGLINELILSKLSDDVMPGVIENHHLPDHQLGEMLEEVFGQMVDIVVFGRTLYALIEEHQDILFINPGSPNLPRHLQKLGTVAILNLTPDSREVRLIELVNLS